MPSAWARQILDVRGWDSYSGFFTVCLIKTRENYQNHWENVQFTTNTNQRRTDLAGKYFHDIYVMYFLIIITSQSGWLCQEDHETLGVNVLREQKNQCLCYVEEASSEVDDWLYSCGCFQHLGWMQETKNCRIFVNTGNKWLKFCFRAMNWSNLRWRGMLKIVSKIS